ncbi:unnamed protein product, partial [Linum tenue]
MVGSHNWVHENVSLGYCFEPRVLLYKLGGVWELEEKLRRPFFCLDKM